MSGSGRTRITFKLFGVLVWLAVVSGAWPIQTVLGASQKEITVVALKKAISQGNEFALMDLLGQVQRTGVIDMSVESDILRLLDDVWENRESEYPEIDWAVAHGASVRSFVGVTLLFLDKHNLYEANEKTFRDYARGVLDHYKSVVVANAVRMLGLLDGAQDVKILKGVALESDELKFRTAVLVLAEMCVPEARSALMELREKAAPDRTAFINEQLKAFGGDSRRVRGCE